MNKHQAMALLVVLTTGCSAPRSFMAETDSEETQQKHQPLSRTQSVAQLQVDAVLSFKPGSTAAQARLNLQLLKTMEY